MAFASNSILPDQLLVAITFYLADQKLPMSRPVMSVGDWNLNSTSICWGLGCPAGEENEDDMEEV